MGIRQAWEISLKREGHVRDAAQEEVVALLEDVAQQLVAANKQSKGLLSRFRQKQPESVRGLYIWGGVGRGKTFLMDLFFETLEITAKKRIHFHRMMHDVHARLALLGDIENPLDQVAADIAAETRVLCFDVTKKWQPISNPKVCCLVFVKSSPSPCVAFIFGAA